MTEVAKHLQGTDTAIHAALRELFVINLCASMTPMPEVPKHLKGFEKHKLYQISKVEDGRRRYRLRIGFFHTETDAQLLVASLRSMYPAALVACAMQEDLRFAGDLPAAAIMPASKAAPQAAEPTKVQLSPEPMKVSAPATVPAPARKPAAELTTVDPPAVSTAKPNSTAPAQPFHVGRGINIPETSLELSAETPSPFVNSAASAKHPEPEHAVAAVKPVAVQPIVKSTAPAAKPVAVATSPVARPAAPSPVAAKPAVKQPIVSATIQTAAAKDDYIPILDTTLTIRTLTKAEAEDPNRPKWFVVQLATSEQPININTMPKLDIFVAYSLYSVAVMEGGSIHHTLRLGFFKEKVSADAVMGYLKTFFNAPSVVQIASAEYDRFSEPKQPKPEAVVSQLNERRAAAPAAKSVAPAPSAKATVPVGASTRRPPPSATKSVAATIRPEMNKQPSFLSRLIGKQLD